MDDNNEHSHRILLVEDSVSLAKVLANLLRSKGLIVEVCHNGVLALEALETFKADVVVTDYEMPEMNGPTLCTKIKANEALKHIPIIMLTSKDDGKSILTGIKAGADDYLTKKIATEILEVKIQAMLRLKTLREQLLGLNRLDAIKEVIVTYNHEFNNPLTILFGFAEKMKRDASPEQLEMLGKIDAQLARIKGIADNISKIKNANESSLPTAEDYTGNIKMLKII